MESCKNQWKDDDNKGMTAPMPIYWRRTNPAIYLGTSKDLIGVVRIVTYNL